MREFSTLVRAVLANRWPSTQQAPQLGLSKLPSLVPKFPTLSGCSGCRLAEARRMGGKGGKVKIRVGIGFEERVAFVDGG